ncbi:MAG: hypothetical protein L3K26_11490, partial [Candidatus Hydrogenedentes bacterium]|nr:hypothetical protein [Candidatus Hydrogenedentota bacterium]
MGELDSHKSRRRIELASPGDYDALMFNFRLSSLILALIVTPLALAQDSPTTRAAVTQCMGTATDFLFDTLSNQGGFVWFYTMDLEPYGELKARPSMIWVEPPGTPSVGLVLLEAYKATGNTAYLKRANQVAEALTKGQHPSGGWNYFIDFDPDGLLAYYASFFSKCWGWQEYLKQRNNATFDDYSTTEATRFFLRLHAVTKDARHRGVLDKALDHILRAQYPDGGWPQRFPDAAADHDYSNARTFNDDVIYDCIQVLLEAHGRLGNERYREAAIRGMDFYLRAQLPAPQAGWAQQYGADLKPVWGRPFEIGTVCSTETVGNIYQLFEFYAITGDRKYLEPVPRALDWLEASRLSGAEGYTHTGFYEMGTNRPIFIKQTGTSIEDVRYRPTYEKAGCYPYAHEVTINVEALRKEHARLVALSPEKAMAAYRERKQKQLLPKNIRGGHLAVALSKTSQTPEGIAAIIHGLDERGGWRDPVTQLHPFHPFTEAPLKTEAYIVGGYI